MASFSAHQRGWRVAWRTVLTLGLLAGACAAGGPTTVDSGSSSLAPWAPLSVSYRLTAVGRDGRPEGIWPGRLGLLPGRGWAGDAAARPVGLKLRPPRERPGNAPLVQRYPLPLADGATFRHARHLRKGSLRAFGFLAVPGTPAVAVRAGYVVELDTSRSEQEHATGRLDRANVVTVLHDDGTLADYLFIAPGSERVRRGQRVREGMALAAVGRAPLYFRVRQQPPQGIGDMELSFVNGPGHLQVVELQVGRLERVDHSGALSNWLAARFLRHAESGGHLLPATLAAAITAGSLIAWALCLRHLTGGRLGWRGVRVGARPW